MTRYMNQISLSCGPISIINALKKFGHRLNTKHLSYFRKLCKYSRKYGVFSLDFYGAIVKLNGRSWKIFDELKPPRASGIARFLRHNPSGAVILCCTPQKSRHACTVVEISRRGRHLLVANGKHDRLAWFPIREVQRWIRQDDHATAYFLLPRQKGRKRGRM